MGNIMSPVKSIDKLSFEPLKRGSVRKATRVLQVDEDVALVELDNGRIVAVGQGSAVNKYAIVGFGAERWSKTILNGLAVLGVCTKADVDAHLKRVEEVSRKRNTRYALSQLKQNCETLGIDIPEEAKKIEEGYGG